MATISELIQNPALAHLMDARDILSALKDQERYRKLRAELEFSPFHTGLTGGRRGEFYFIEGRFDSAVDALKDPNGKKQSRRAR